MYKKNDANENGVLENLPTILGICIIKKYFSYLLFKLKITFLQRKNNNK